jgi:hypothetical protein
MFDLCLRHKTGEIIGTKKLTAAKAYDLWIKEHPLTYAVTGKFNDAHIITNLTKKKSIEAAIKRYKEDQNIKLSSWIGHDKDKLVAKAQGAHNKRASVHQGAQQLTVAIKVKRRTVKISPLTKKELQRYEHEDVEIGSEMHHLNCSSDEQEIILLIVGPWNPLTGEVGLYHYKEGTIPADHQMLDKFLEWNVDETTKKPVSPVATK